MHYHCCHGRYNIRVHCTVFYSPSLRALPLKEGESLAKLIAVTADRTSAVIENPGLKTSILLPIFFKQIIAIPLLSKNSYCFSNALPKGNHVIKIGQPIYWGLSYFNYRFSYYIVAHLMSTFLPLLAFLLASR